MIILFTVFMAISVSALAYGAYLLGEEDGRRALAEDIRKKFKEMEK